MTWSMYDGLYEACERADADEAVRIMLLRGSGGAAFVAGTDIDQFREFTSGDHEVAYEKRMGEVIDRLGGVRVPTVAEIAGPCVGGGFAIAAMFDLRIASTSARFGVPVARTLGDCLSMNTHALLVEQLGTARTLDILCARACSTPTRPSRSDSSPNCALPTSWKRSYPRSSTAFAGTRR